ncbi:MAG: transposase [Nitrososphaerota archaeon]|jgi:putative transposase|nr:transposase [Nitrososphaerota archaeon]MDG7045359.1 transposase [Nitrososphaerota archaeon]
MYYGDPLADGVVGTQPKKGTHWAYQYGSMSVVLEGERLAVAMTPIVKGGQSRALHVRRLLGKASELGIKVKLVLLDAGHFSVDVINYLKSSGLKFIMRMPNIGIARAGDDFIYTTTSHRRPNNWQATFRVVAMNGRDGVGHRKLFIFATNTDLKARRIGKLFRKRWAIETSYRMINQFLPKTAFKAYSVRRLYFYLTVLMCNSWVMVNYGRARVIVERVRLMIVITIIFWASMPWMTSGNPR